MSTEIMNTENMTAQINAIDCKFMNLFIEASQNIASMPIEAIPQYEAILKEEREKITIRIMSIRMLKGNAYCDVDEYTEKIKPYLQAIGFNPIVTDNDYRIKKTTNAKGEPIEINQCKLHNNLVNDWKSKDKVFTTIEILEGFKLPIDLKNECVNSKNKLKNNDADKLKTVVAPSILKKYREEFKAASLIADGEFFEQKKDMNIRNYYLNASRAFISMKLNLVRIKKESLKVSKKADKAADSRSMLTSKYGVKPVKTYGDKTQQLNILAKKFGII